MGEHPIKRGLAVTGDGSVGKTTMLIYFARGFYSQVYIPVVAENYTVEVPVGPPGDRKVVELTFYDTAGQEDYPRLRPLAYREAHVLLICFSIDYPESLENVLERWIVEAKFERPDLPILLIACKSDLRLVAAATGEPILVTEAEGAAVAKRIGAQAYLECSAKTGQGITEVFEAAASCALSTRKRKAKSSCIVL